MKKNINKLIKIFKLIMPFISLFSGIDLNLNCNLLFEVVSRQRLINKGLLKIPVVEPKYQFDSFKNKLKFLWSGIIEFPPIYPKTDRLTNEILIIELKEISKDVYSYEERIFKFTNKFKMFMAFIVSIFYFTTLSQVNVWNIYDIQVYYGYLVFLVGIFFSIDYLYNNDGDDPISPEMLEILLSNFPTDKHEIIKELVTLINLHSKK